MSRALLRSAVLVALSLVPLTGGGCESMPNLPWVQSPDSAVPVAEDWQASEPIVFENFDLVWERTKNRLQGDGYTVDPNRTSRQDREMVTFWRTMLGPQRYQGRRNRVWVRYEKTGDGEWVAKVAVQAQRNTELADPMNPAAAEWEEQPADNARARVLAFHLERDFAPRDK